MEASAQEKPVSEVYYDSDYAWKFYSIVNSSDYSGMGIWEQQAEQDYEGYVYPRGEGRSIREATMVRDQRML